MRTVTAFEVVDKVVLPCSHPDSFYYGVERHIIIMAMGRNLIWVPGHRGTGKIYHQAHLDGYSKGSTFWKDINRGGKLSRRLLEKNDGKIRQFLDIHMYASELYVPGKTVVITECTQVEKIKSVKKFIQELKDQGVII